MRAGSHDRTGRFSVARLLERRRSQAGDAGFVLLESIISITIITVIMGALGVFFTSTMHTSNHLRHDQSAAQIADDAVEAVRAIDSTSVLSGRDLSSVTAENAAAPSGLSGWLSTMTVASDSHAPVGAGRNPCPSPSSCALLPTVPISEIVSGLPYSTTYYIGTCYRAQASPGTDCTSTGGAGFISYLRVVIAITWTENSCSSGQCLYVTSTFVNASANPVFNLNSAPPPAPTAATPPNQTSAVGDPVSYNLSATSGVPPFTWTGANLPAGLALNSAGLISGSPTTAGAARTVTVTVTDAFLRTDSTTFTWTVLPPLAAAQPADQTSTWHTAISNLTLSASGGSGSGYVWTDGSTTLPPGLSLSSAGVISGTPTATGDYPVTITVKDSANRTDTVSFDWLVNYPPLVATQSNVTSTVNASTSLTLVASGGSGSYTWSDPSNTLSATGLGLSMTPAGVITGTPTTSKAYSISLLVTDSLASMTKTVTFTWTVVTLPTVMSPGPQAGTVGRPVNVPLTYNCTASPCTITATGLPAGLSISGTSIVGTLPATVTGSSDVFAGIQLSIKDSNNRTSNASATFAWTVNAAPVVTVTNQLNVTGSAIDEIPATVTKGTGPYTFTITSKPTGTSMTDTTIGEITGTATTSQALTGIKVTVVDASGYSVTSTAFTWTIKNTVILQNVAAPTFCGVAGGSPSPGYYLAAGACSSGVQLTYTNTRLLQVTSSPTLCVQAVATAPNTLGATCNATNTAQQWLFNANGSISNISNSKCLDLPTGAVSGTAFDLVNCPTVTTRMLWTIQ